MELNKCQRCGCFFAHEGTTCSKCSSKDINELSVLNTYLSNIDGDISLNELSENTGVSVKNINRLMDNSPLDNLKFNGHISIGL